MSNGYFTGKGTSYKLRKDQLKALGIKRRWWQKALYMYVEDPEDPLVYHCDGSMVKPRSGLVHDYGSIPRLLQIIPCFSKDRYADAYIIHDSCYAEHKILHSIDIEADEKDKTIEYLLVNISKRESDLLLKEMILSLGSTISTAESIYSAVKYFGFFCW